MKKGWSQFSVISRTTGKRGTFGRESLGIWRRTEPRKQFFNKQCPAVIFRRRGRIPQALVLLLMAVAVCFFLLPPPAQALNLYCYAPSSTPNSSLTQSVLSAEIGPSVNNHYSLTDSVHTRFISVLGHLTDLFAQLENRTSAGDSNIGNIPAGTGVTRIIATDKGNPVVAEPAQGSDSNKQSSDASALTWDFEAEFIRGSDQSGDVFKWIWVQTPFSFLGHQLRQNELPITTDIPSRNACSLDFSPLPPTASDFSMNLNPEPATLSLFVLGLACVGLAVGKLR